MYLKYSQILFGLSHIVRFIVKNIILIKSDECRIQHFNKSYLSSIYIDRSDVDIACMHSSIICICYLSRFDFICRNAEKIDPFKKSGFNEFKCIARQTNIALITLIWMYL